MSASTITQDFQTDTKNFVIGMDWIQQEAKDIYKAYFASDASTLVNALGSSSAGASLATKYTKAQYQNAIGFIEQLTKFFDNQAVTTGDYLTNIEQVIYANAATPAFLSDAAESIANRIKVLCDSSLNHFNLAKKIKSIYDNSELSVLVAGLSAGRVIYGSTMNNTQLTQGITLVEQYKKMINNEAVTTGLYSANISVWLSL